MHCKFLIGILIFSCMTFAETHIAGNIGKMTFDRTGNPYIVEKDIIIPSGEEVTIKEGCVFLFNTFTGLTIQGKIVVQGSNSAPVVFTSLHDNEVNPDSKQIANPFDWNGILISRESASSVFKNFALRYSVYGIKAQTQNVYLENGIFRQNGQFHFTINDKIEYVQDNLPYSYGAPLIVEALQNGKSKQPGTNLSTKKIAAEKSPVSKGSLSPTRAIVRNTGLGVGIVGGTSVLTAGVIAGIKYGDILKITKDLEKSPQNSITDRDSAQATYDKLMPGAKKAYNTVILITIISGVISALGFTTFALTFNF